MSHFVLKLTDPTCPECLNETLENDLKKALRFPNQGGSESEWPAFARRSKCAHAHFVDARLNQIRQATAGYDQQ